MRVNIGLTKFSKWGGKKENPVMKKLNIYFILYIGLLEHMIGKDCEILVVVIII